MCVCTVSTYLPPISSQRCCIVENVTFPTVPQENTAQKGKIVPSKLICWYYIPVLCMWRNVMASFSFQKICLFLPLMTRDRAACTKWENWMFPQLPNNNSQPIQSKNHHFKMIFSLNLHHVILKKKCKFFFLKSAALPHPTPQGWISLCLEGTSNVS